MVFYDRPRSSEGSGRRRRSGPPRCRGSSGSPSREVDASGLSRIVFAPSPEDSDSLSIARIELESPAMPASRVAIVGLLASANSNKVTQPVDRVS